MITFDDEMNKLPPERRVKIEAKTEELLQEIQLIDKLRQLLGIPSEKATESNNNSSSLATQSDDFPQQLTLEKLTQMISELGGEWELTLKFPDTQVIKLTNHLK